MKRSMGNTVFTQSGNTPTKEVIWVWYRIISDGEAQFLEF